MSMVSASLAEIARVFVPDWLAAQLRNADREPAARLHDALVRESLSRPGGVFGCAVHGAALRTGDESTPETFGGALNDCRQVCYRRGRLFEAARVTPHDSIAHGPSAQYELEAECQRDDPDEVAAEALAQHVVNPCKRVRGSRFCHCLPFVAQSTGLRAGRYARKSLDAKQLTRLDDHAGGFIRVRSLVRRLSIGMIRADQFTKARAHLVRSRL